MLHFKFGWNPWTFIIVISDPKVTLLSDFSVKTHKVGDIFHSLDFAHIYRVARAHSGSDSV